MANKDKSFFYIMRGDKNFIDLLEDFVATDVKSLLIVKSNSELGLKLKKESIERYLELNKKILKE